MKSIELAGSHYEIGLKLGRILKKEHGYPPRYPKEVVGGTLEPEIRYEAVESRSI
jgi:hypothetical protein